MNVDLISSKFDILDQHYFEGMDRETEDLAKLGVYEKAADMLDLKKGDIHIDFGSGNGEFLSRLNKIFPQAILIGVERRKLDIALSASRLRSSGAHIWQLFSESIKANGEGTAEKSFFVEDERFNEKSYLHEGFVTLVQDDIKSLKVLKKLLETRKADSASLMFPAPSESMAFEAPHKLDELNSFAELLEYYRSLKSSKSCDPMELTRVKNAIASHKLEIGRRLALIMNQIRGSIYHNISELVKFKGNLVIAERADSTVMPTEERAQKIKQYLMDDNNCYWNPEMTVRVDKGKFDLSPKDSLHEEGIQSDCEEKSVLIHRFVRKRRAIIKPAIRRFFQMLNLSAYHENPIPIKG